MPYASQAQSRYIHMLANRGTKWAQKFVHDAHGTHVPDVRYARKKALRKMVRPNS